MTDLAKMNELINKLSDEEFKYGKNDCYLFTTRLIKEWHGADYDYTDLHAVYKNEIEAELYMESFGGIEALTTGTLGYSVSPQLCRDGDMVSAEVGGGIALGFVFKEHGLFKAKKKVLKIPLSQCRLGWRIK